MPAIEIRPDHWAIVATILQKYVPDCDVYAFGSRAHFNAKPYSDLDLAIMTKAPLDLALAAEMAEAFSESDLPWKVDLVDWATTSDAFKRIIELHKVLVQRACSV